ncbi:MAG: hypothetical protein DMG41_30045 [Acidobacteria bacterium]|nr:MAG: hypothetical protein DMG41_30045 [Acidobacteriota bacterium]
MDSVDGNSGFTWTADGKLLYTSLHAAGESMRMVTSDGHNVRDFPLSTVMNRRPSACPDGRYILYTSQTDAGRNVWRRDFAGNEAKQLTFGNEDGYAQCSSDGKWFIYGSSNKGHSTLFKMSIEGGQPQRQISRRGSTFARQQVGCCSFRGRSQAHRDGRNFRGRRRVAMAF